MKIKVIAAVDRNMGIGYNNDLLVYDKEDMDHFKLLTTGHPVIVGRKTWDSLPKRCLPNRHLLVVTSSPLEGNLGETDSPVRLLGHFIVDAKQLEEVVTDSFDYSTLWVAGGATLYNYYIRHGLADEIVLTQFNASLKADTYFPTIPDTYKIYHTKKISNGIIYFFKKLVLL